MMIFAAVIWGQSDNFFSYLHDADQVKFAGFVELHDAHALAGVFVELCNLYTPA
jgi:hypothetical protein